jgi:outer membrane protein TolC
MLLSACVHIESQPLEPQRSLNMLERRRLTDAEVLARVQAAFPDSQLSSPQAPWDRGELLVAALQLNPGLAEARSQITQAAAAIRTAHAIQNPTISLASEYDVSRAAEPTWLWGVSSSMLLDTFLSRNLRTNIAAAGLRGARADFSDAVWSVRRELRVALLSAVIAERRIPALELQTRQREDLVRLVRARVSAGEAARPAALQEELELARSRAALEEARRAQSEARAKLSAALGVSMTALNGVVLRWDDIEELSLPPQTQFAALRERALLARPDLERAIADYDARELELRQQARAQYLQLSLGPGYTWDHGIRKVTFGASLSLPVFNQNQGPIAEALAAREAAGQHALAVQAMVLSDIEVQTAMYENALDALSRAREQRATSEALAQSAREALVIDAEDRPTTLAAELVAGTERLAELDAIERAQLALGQLEDALRAPLFGPETALFREGAPSALVQDLP